MVSVVIPVKDGARYLREVLDALLRQLDAGQVLVVDSGSSDGSVAIARAAGVEVLEIAPDEFGHGRTRNLGAERTTGDVICFLTQDATPVDGWIERLLEGFALDERVGAVYGPHLPRPGSPPMIARELTDFFAQFAPGRGPVLQGPGDLSYLSNSNAAYRRSCWEQIRFRDLPYAEDQAFGRDMLAAGWLKAYVPEAGVLHSHDYRPLAFARRYFDEYRGLRETTGHVEPFRVKAGLGAVRRLTRADLRWMREQGWSRPRRARWAARAIVHHANRRVFSALGSRAESLPGPVRRWLSLERRH
jgi:rhamnosyltransferase